MTDRELDVLMRRVLLDSLKLDWDKKPETPFEPSAGYRREISAMLADPLAWERKKARPIWKTAARRAAIVLLIISLSLGGVMAASPTVRAAFLQWIVEWYEDRIVYRHAGADITETMPRYEITELPEGYVEVEDERIEWPMTVEIVYRNEESGEEIVLDYDHIQQGSLRAFVLDGVEAIPIMVNGLEGQFFLEEGETDRPNTITWVDPNGNMQFTVHANLSKDNILHIAESVSLADSTK